VSDPNYLPTVFKHFTAGMEHTLREQEQKKDNAWKGATMTEVMDRLLVETNNLKSMIELMESAVEKHAVHSTDEMHKRISKQATIVADYAMFVSATTDIFHDIVTADFPDTTKK